MARNKFGPKRRVHREFHQMNNALDTTEQFSTFRAVTETETLIRVIIDIIIIGSSTFTGVTNFGLSIEKRPRGIEVTNNIAFATATHTMPTQEIWRVFGALGRGDDTGADPMIRYQDDLKSMRKFIDGDTFGMKQDSDASVLALRGYVVSFWMDA